MVSRPPSFVPQKFDAVLAETEKREDPVRVRGVTRHVADSRRELAEFLRLPRSGG
jgi:hypothetical protein